MIKLLTIKLRVSIEYSDIEYYCKSSAISTPLILTMELDDKNKIVRASLKKNKDKTYILESDELDNINILSEAGLSWIKSIVLSDNLLRFMVYADSHLTSMCSPPENLEDLKAHNIVIDFGVSSIGYLLPYMMTSNTVSINGQNSKNNWYQINLALTQLRV